MFAMSISKSSRVVVFVVLFVVGYVAGLDEEEEKVVELIHIHVPFCRFNLFFMLSLIVCVF